MWLIIRREKASKRVFHDSKILDLAKTSKQLFKYLQWTNENNAQRIKGKYDDSDSYKQVKNLNRES